MRRTDDADLGSPLGASGVFGTDCDRTCECDDSSSGSYILLAAREMVFVWDRACIGLLALGLGKGRDCIVRSSLLSILRSASGSWSSGSFWSGSGIGVRSIARRGGFDHIL